jgi:hypothetical protein
MLPTEAILTLDGILATPMNRGFQEQGFRKTNCYRSQLFDAQVAGSWSLMRGKPKRRGCIDEAVFLFGWKGPRSDRVDSRSLAKG